mgnify:CR=1 FL=1
MLENIVYTYARSKGYAISVGRIGKLECDFILRNQDNGYAYIQAAMTIMNDRSTEDRKYKPFECIRDNYPKFLITRSDPVQRRGGVIHVNLNDVIEQGLRFETSPASTRENDMRP